MPTFETRLYYTRNALIPKVIKSEKSPKDRTDFTVKTNIRRFLRAEKMDPFSADPIKK